MRDLKVKEVVDVMGKLGMRVFDGAYDITLGGVRNVNQVSNTFDDKLFMLYRKVKGGELFIEQWDATTDCGLYYLENPLNRKGAGILVHDMQHKGMYELRDAGHKGYEAFRQVRPASFVRDNNKDNILDFDLMKEPKNVFKDVIYANIHRTNSKNIESVQVGKWSAACQVVSKEESLQEMIALAKKQIQRGHGNYFSYALLFGEHFEGLDD